MDLPLLYNRRLHHQTGYGKTHTFLDHFVCPLSNSPLENKFGKVQTQDIVITCKKTQEQEQGHGEVVGLNPCQNLLCWLCLPSAVQSANIHMDCVSGAKFLMRQMQDQLHIMSNYIIKRSGKAQILPRRRNFAVIYVQLFCSL